MYTVRAGDTLSRIAQRHNTSVVAIARANHIQNVNVIHVGQRLAIPGDKLRLTPRPAPPRPAAPIRPAGASPSLEQQRVLQLVNAARTRRGLAPLRFTAGLNQVARQRSQDMVRRNYFSHTDPSGRNPYWHMRRAGISYRTAGENIAWGQRSPEEVVRAWMNSPGHRANILNPHFSQMGLGVARKPDGTPTWTQLFTN